MQNMTFDARHIRDNPVELSLECCMCYWVYVGTLDLPHGWRDCTVTAEVMSIQRTNYRLVLRESTIWADSRIGIERRLYEEAYQGSHQKDGKEGTRLSAREITSDAWRDTQRFYFNQNSADKDEWRRRWQNTNRHRVLSQNSKRKQEEEKKFFFFYFSFPLFYRITKFSVPSPTTLRHNDVHPHRCVCIIRESYCQHQQQQQHQPRINGFVYLYSFDFEWFSFDIPSANLCRSVVFCLCAQTNKNRIFRQTQLCQFLWVSLEIPCHSFAIDEWCNTKIFCSCFAGGWVVVCLLSCHIMALFALCRSFNTIHPTERTEFLASDMKEFAYH